MSLIRIDPLIVEGSEILPAFEMEDEIGNYKDPPLKVYRTAPSLAQLRHAYETNAVVRRNILDNKNRSEWTATFLRNGKEAVERPESVRYENGLWVAEGGKAAKIELPPYGWTLEYDNPTGFPARTGSWKDAEKVFGNDASFFYAGIGRNELNAVCRGFGWGGPFSVSALWLPDYRRDGSGSRSVRQF